MRGEIYVAFTVISGQFYFCLIVIRGTYIQYHVLILQFKFLNLAHFVIYWKSRTKRLTIIKALEIFFELFLNILQSKLWTKQVLKLTSVWFMICLLIWKNICFSSKNDMRVMTWCVKFFIITFQEYFLQLKLNSYYNNNWIEKRNWTWLYIMSEQKWFIMFVFMSEACPYNFI